MNHAPFASGSISRRKELRIFLYWYLAAWLGILILLAALLLFSNFPTEQKLQMFKRAFFALSREYIVWLVLLLPYGIFRLLRYLYRTYKTRGARVFARALALRIVAPVLVMSAAFYLLRQHTRTESFVYEWGRAAENHTARTRDLFAQDGKQRGMHFFAGMRVEEKHLLPLVRNNVEWIAQVPFGWQEHHDQPELHMSALGNMPWSEADSGIAQITLLARGHGLKTMLKPHVWLRNRDNGVWLSHIAMNNETDWQTWFANYRAFILHYARLAEHLQIELFCIGTELHATVKQKPEFWRGLIKEIRGVYRGKLTYGANWDREFEDVTFWDELDFIGVQAYFPLSEKEQPAREELIAGWQPHVQRLERLSQKYRKPILFTELGYRSMSNAAVAPWEWPRMFAGLFQKVSTQTQADCFAAFFEVFWEQEWFAGAHVWKWSANHETAGGKTDLDFTPQNKSAENVLAKGFGKIGKQNYFGQND